MTYTAWARIPPGRWFEVARADDEDGKESAGESKGIIKVRSEP